jgi:hypothetical protein
MQLFPNLGATYVYNLVVGIKGKQVQRLEGSSPTTGLTLLWARNPVRGNSIYCQVSRIPGWIFKHFDTNICFNFNFPLSNLLKYNENNNGFREISSSHGGEYEVKNCLLGCTAV